MDLTKHISEYSKEKLLELFRAENFLKFILPSKDVLTIHRFKVIGTQGHAICVQFGETISDEPGSYHVMQPDYFPVEMESEAIDAFIERVMAEKPFRSNARGRPMYVIREMIENKQKAA